MIGFSLIEKLKHSWIIDSIKCLLDKKHYRNEEICPERRSPVSSIPERIRKDPRFEEYKDKLVRNILINVNNAISDPEIKHFVIAVSQMAYTVLTSGFPTTCFNPLTFNGYLTIPMPENFLRHPWDFRILEIKEPIYETDPSEW